MPRIPLTYHYQMKPAVTRWGRKPIRYVECSECQSLSTTLDSFLKDGAECPDCNQNSLKIVEAGYSETGWICPGCGEVLYPNVSRVEQLHLDPDQYGEEERSKPLSHDAFAVQKNSNTECYNCGCSLWTPNIMNLNQSTDSLVGKKGKEKPWVRISYWRNHNKKTTKTVWVYRKFLNSFLYENKIKDDSWSFVKEQKSRKISPVRYMKKNIPDKSIDYFISDESHQFLSGGSAQANAFHVLIKKSAKQIILTGTLLGGVAKDLFYLLYRLEPRKMKGMGFEYNDILKFSQIYGVVEERVQYNSEDELRNTSSRGKRIGEPRVKPGISPLLYSHFLLEKCAFLSLNELSSFLPKFEEQTIRLEMDDKMRSVYGTLQHFFKSRLKDPGGKRLMSSMLQTLLSFPDKLCGYDPIRDPSSGGDLLYIPSLDTDVLYPKEKALVDLIQKEISEGRNCVVFSIYSGENGDKDTLPRIASVIEKNCDLQGKVDILRSTTVKAEAREDWIQCSVKRGTRVVVCNPRLVETGLDLIEHPTLIFYSTGYSLFTVWQASRRAYRLIQKKDCRVFYMAYKQTLQDDCLSIMASKKVATAAIQGSFSSEGLAAMAQGVDPQVLLAQALMNGSSVKDSEMERMFSKINQANNVTSELSEEDLQFLMELKAMEEEEQSAAADIFTVAEQIAQSSAEPATTQQQATDKGATFNLLSGFFDLIDFVKNDCFGNTSQEQEPVLISVDVTPPKKRTKKNMFSESQLSLDI